MWLDKARAGEGEILIGTLCNSFAQAERTEVEVDRQIINIRTETLIGSLQKEGGTNERTTPSFSLSI